MVTVVFNTLINFTELHEFLDCTKEIWRAQKSSFLWHTAGHLYLWSRLMASSSLMQVCSQNLSPFWLAVNTKYYFGYFSEP